jgi:hypothetical protein
VARQTAIDRGPPGDGIKALDEEPVPKRPGSPSGVLDSQRDDASLDDRTHQMRARLQLAGAVHEAGKAPVGVFHKPLVDRLTADPVASGHVGNRGAVVENLPHGLIALLHQPQLPKHERLPSHPRTSTTTSERGGTALEADSRGVAQVPESLSPGYRSRVREVSTSYRSHGVNHEPESHTLVMLGICGCGRCRGHRAVVQDTRKGPSTTSFSSWT